VIDRELPVMAVVALAVGLLLTIGISSFAGTEGSAGEELRRAAERESSDLAALRVDPVKERRIAAARKRRAQRRVRRARRARVAQARRRVARRTGRAVPATVPEPGTDPQQSFAPVRSTQPQPAPAPRPDPAPKPKSKPKPKPSGGGSAQPFDDSG
jgi:hypothetical protein